MIKSDKDNIELSGTIGMLMAEFVRIVKSFVLNDDEAMNKAGSSMFREDWYKLKEIAKNLENRME